MVGRKRTAKRKKEVEKVEIFRKGRRNERKPRRGRRSEERKSAGNKRKKNKELLST